MVKTQYPNGSQTKPYITSPYGPRKGGNSDFHHGTDYNGFAAINPVAGGIVTFAGQYTEDAGHTVAIDYPYRGENGEVITIVYMHMDKIYVRKGQRVNLSTVLGTMGRTGNATGLCVHVEVRYWLNGRYRTVDADRWIAWKISLERPRPAAVSEYRTVVRNAGVNARVSPNTKSRIDSGNTLTAGSRGRFKGYVVGENIKGNNIWFVGYYSGHYYWSGGFINKTTVGLKRL